MPNKTTIDSLLDAALGHVPFDGWTETTFRAAINDSAADAGMAAALCPRGAIDLAAAYHRRGDHAMVLALQNADLSELRFRDKIGKAVQLRLAVAADKEVVRRGATLFAMPQHAAEGAKLIWGTSDLIWQTLGDTSDDINWYSKRSILAGVYSSTVLYWLGDHSANDSATQEFLERRIDNVMQFEKAKAAVKKSPLLRAALAGPIWALGKVRKPARTAGSDLPGK
jgi:ubiquinone biosynthesis protein COQ9